ncbi:unnamed protein product [Pleuronectes platessa]|uniref:Uncharacterized protein n=1 Tax=Pleuronectes platessa TaxID=8262 RepID=A0A9N7UA31_PLEPL|nr:unnamed protein product [Pleuronectes platessa]
MEGSLVSCDRQSRCSSPVTTVPSALCTELQQFVIRASLWSRRANPGTDVRSMVDCVEEQFVNLWVQSARTGASMEQGLKGNVEFLYDTGITQARAVRLRQYKQARTRHERLPHPATVPNTNNWPFAGTCETAEPGGAPRGSIARSCFGCGFEIPPQPESDKKYRTALADTVPGAR